MIIIINCLHFCHVRDEILDCFLFITVYIYNDNGRLLHIKTNK